MRPARVLAQLTALWLVLATPASAQPGSHRFQLPEYEKTVLANGLTLYLMQQDEVPLVSITTVIRAGSEHDGSQLGLASLTLDGLQMGTPEFTKQTLEDLFAFHGADISTQINPDSAAVSLSLATKDLGALMPVYFELLRHPRFPVKDTDKLIKLHRQMLQQRVDSPRKVIHQYFYRMLFDTHVYGNPVEGTPATIETIGPADLAKFHKSLFQPNQMAITVVGDFDRKRLQSDIESLVGSWENSPITASKPTPISYQNHPRVVVVNKEDSRETAIRIGGRGFARSNPDYVELSVINSVLGQGFTSWLMTALRVDAGLTYSVSSRFRPLRQGGVFYISTFTQTDTTFETIDLALATYDRLLQGGLSTEKLQGAKNYIVGLFPPKFERGSDLSLFLADMYIYEFDESYVNTFEDKVNGLNLARANELIKQYFPREELVIVLIGQADAIADKAKRYGQVHRLEITDTLPRRIGFSL